MLNLSENRIDHLVEKSSMKSFGKLKNLNAYTYSRLKYVLLIVFGALLLSMFLPWTQNVRSKGELIALNPEQRPQTIQSVIAGKIEQWYVS